MWIVIYKMEHYPSVFEFDNEEEAREKYEQLISKNFLCEDCEDDGDEKVILCKMEDSHGDFNKNVEWYV